MVLYQSLVKLFSPEIFNLNSFFMGRLLPKKADLLQILPREGSSGKVIVFYQHQDPAWSAQKYFKKLMEEMPLSTQS